MKRIVVPILMALCMMTPLSGREGLSVSLDLVSAESFFYDTAHLRIDLGLDLTEEFGLRMPFTVIAERVRGGPYYLEGGIFLDYHPLGWPLFISLSLAQVGVLGNHPWEDDPSVLFLNEMAIGWRFAIPPGFVLIPMVVIRDPNRVFGGEYAEFEDIFAHFAMVRCSLLFGWTFPVGQPRAGQQ